MVYILARVLCRFILFFIRRWEVEGSENMPPSGGVVIVSNHTSFWDPVIIGCCFDRKVSYMAKEELYNVNPIFTWLIRQLKTFPVKRGKMDREALKHALQHLREGNIIALFPEGSRSKTGDLQEARNGAAMFALKTNSLILPVGIIGAKGWGKITVKVGQPISTAKYCGEKINKETLQMVSSEFMAEIEKLTADNADSRGYTV